MCKLAKRVAREFKNSINGYTPIEDYAVNYSVTDCEDTSNLSPFLIVSKWYEYGNLYNYNQESSDLFISKLIVLHMMFIITFFGLLINCYIKYIINKLAIYF